MIKHQMTIDDVIDFDNCSKVGCLHNEMDFFYRDTYIKVKNIPEDIRRDDGEGLSEPTLDQIIELIRFAWEHNMSEIYYGNELPKTVY